MSGKYRLMTRLLYGSGLRLMECMRLRVKDIDFGQHQIIIRDMLLNKNCSGIFAILSCSMKMILPTVLAEFPFHMPWLLNTPVLSLSGNGNISSHPRTSQRIRAPVS
jgi:hypothetical protein